MELLLFTSIGSLLGGYTYGSYGALMGIGIGVLLFLAKNRN
jgi:hypothetical protein